MSGERVLLPAGVLPAFGSGRVAPYQFAVTGEESLLVSLTSTMALLTPPGIVALIFLRMVLPDGTIQVASDAISFDNVTNPSQLLIPLPVGAVTNVSVAYNDAFTENGANYVTAFVVRGTNPAAVQKTGQLLGGYLKPGKALSWPGSEIRGWDEGPGFYKSITFGTFGFGGDAGVNVGIPAIWRPIAFTGTLVTSAVAGTRFPALVLTDHGGTIQWRTPLLATLGASSSGEFNWALEYGSVLPAVGGRNYGPLPDVRLTRNLDILKTNTIGLQAGDAWSSCSCWVEELCRALG